MYITNLALLLTSLVGLQMVKPQNDEADKARVKINANPYTSTITGGSSGYTGGWYQKEFKDGTNETLKFNLYIWDRPTSGEENISETYAKKPNGHATCSIAASQPFTGEVSYTFSNDVNTGFHFDGKYSDDVRVSCETLSGDDLGTLEGKVIDSWQL